MKLSILTTCYNQRAEIERLINSILVQNIPFEYEILIGDDGSTDGSVDYLKKVSEKYPKTIKVYYNNAPAEKLVTIHAKASRASNNRYRLLQEMFKHKSDYFTLIDGDDYYTDENCLDHAVNFLDNNKHIDGICYNFNILYVDRNEMVLKKLNRADYNRKTNLINNKYYQLCCWHHVASFIFRAENKADSIRLLGENNLVDDGNITLKIMDEICYFSGMAGGGYSIVIANQFLFIMFMVTAYGQVVKKLKNIY